MELEIPLMIAGVVTVTGSATADALLIVALVLVVMPLEVVMVVSMLSLMLATITLLTPDLEPCAMLLSRMNLFGLCLSVIW